jgi:aspartyl protease family protein
MKKISLIIVVIFCFNNIYSQKQIKLYFDSSWNKIINSAEAKYYRIITFNQDNKSGILKDYYINKQLQFYGRFSQIDLGYLNFKKEGECVWYFDNGIKSKVGYYKNGLENGTSKYYSETGILETEIQYNNGIIDGVKKMYNEFGKITFEIPFYLGNADTNNIKYYFYFPDRYETFEGNILENKGKKSIYYKDGEIISEYFHHSTGLMPHWIQTTLKGVSDKYSFYENFNNENIYSPWWQPVVSKGIKIFVDERGLVFSLISKNEIHEYSKLVQTLPVSLNDYDFAIDVSISKESRAFVIGMVIYDKPETYSRILLYPTENKIGYERTEDGMVVEESILGEVNYYKGRSNTISLIKKNGEINVVFNGYVINSNIKIGDGGLFGLIASPLPVYTPAVFESVDIDLTKEMKNINEIPLKKLGGVYTLPIKLNGVLDIDFIYDSGATDVSISPDIALTLLKTGTIKESDWLPSQFYQFADGSIAKSKRFKLKSLVIGNKTIYNVSCSISNSIDAPMLLGQSALSKFGKLIFDNQKNLLIIE